MQQEIWKNLISAFKKAESYLGGLEAWLAVISFIVPEQKCGLLTLRKER